MTMICTAARRLTCMLLAIGPLAFSQELKLPDTPERIDVAPPPSDRFPAKWYPRMGKTADLRPAPVLDRPYTATVEHTTISHTPTGETSRYTTYGLQARDRFGRTREESESGVMGVGGQDVKTTSVVVSNPVSHCEFQWTQLPAGIEVPLKHRNATVGCSAQTVRYQDMNFLGSILDTRADGTSVNGDLTTKTEHLASLQIEGLTMKRLRVSNTLLDVHGQAKEWSTETWYSPELKVMTRLGSEEEGYMAFTKIDRKEPDPRGGLINTSAGF